MIRFRWLILIVLMLACLAACAPAAEPTATPTAALPATESSQPTTIVNTPTKERTPRLSALPEQGVKFPGTFEPITRVAEEDLARQSDAFDALYAQYPDLKADADRMVQNLNKLAQAQGIQIITKGYAWENDGDITWGIVAMDSQGYGYIIQKKTSDTTYLSNSNISAYEVLSTGSIDPTMFRLLRIQRPPGIPDDAVSRVVNFSGYKTWAWTKPDGTVLAVLNIPKDIYVQKDGSEWVAQKTYKLLTEDGTWESDCVPNIITSPLEDEEGYLADLADFHKLDPELQADQQNNPDINLLHARPDKYIPYVSGWLNTNFYGVNITEKSYQTICGTIGGFQFMRYSFAFQLQTGEYVTVTMPVAISPSARLEELTRTYGDVQPAQDTLKTALPQYFINSPELRKAMLERVYIISLTESIDGGPLTLTDDPNGEPLREFMEMTNYLARRGVIQALFNLAAGKGTQEDVEIIKKYGIFPALIMGPR